MVALSVCTNDKRPGVSQTKSLLKSTSRIIYGIPLGLSNISLFVPDTKTLGATFELDSSLLGSRQSVHFTDRLYLFQNVCHIFVNLR